MGFRTLENFLFSERSFTLSLKLTVFFSSILLYIALLLTRQTGSLSFLEWKLILYFFYLLIFANTFFCGFLPGIITAILSSILAASTLVPGGVHFDQLTIADLEVFPFIAMYFMVAITVDWFRENIEKLKKQIAENERLHQQARHMEKLTLAGQIAAGIAHEVRNPLTVVQGYLQLIATKCDRRCNSDETFTMLLEELNRADSIISDFLRFSRPDQPKKQKIDIDAVIESTTSLIHGDAVRNNVRIFLYPGQDVPELLLDKDQMVQVLLNLFRNSIQAMSQGGDISVSTTFSKHNSFVEIAVKDTGVGIPADKIDKIFSPFFTTKEDGTGLGLAITQSIVLAHGGQIEVESVAGQGTQFIISLPTVPIEQ